MGRGPLREVGLSQKQKGEYQIPAQIPDINLHVGHCSQEDSHVGAFLLTNNLTSKVKVSLFWVPRQSSYSNLQCYIWECLVFRLVSKSCFSPSGLGKVNIKLLIQPLIQTLVPNIISIKWNLVHLSHLVDTKSPADSTLQLSGIKTSETGESFSKLSRADLLRTTNPLLLFMGIHKSKKGDNRH